MYIYMQCPQDDGAIIISSQIIVASHIRRKHCSCTSNHINTQTSLEESQVESQCGDILQLEASEDNGGHLDSWKYHPLYDWIGLDFIGLDMVGWEHDCINNIIIHHGIPMTIFQMFILKIEQDVHEHNKFFLHSPLIYL